MRFIGMGALLVVAIGTARGQEPEDNFRWLEDVTGQRSLDWVEQRNAESVREFAQSTEFKALEERLLKILDSDARIPLVTKIGGQFYNFWQDARNPKGLWRRTSPTEYRKKDPAWEVVLDLDALGKDEGENWVWQGAQVLEPEDRLCLVSLSRGGADAKVVREFDLERKVFVEGGFRLPEAKSAIAWRSADSVYVGTDFGPDSLTTSGYPRVVKEWKRGTPLDRAEVVLEGRPEDMRVYAYRDFTPDFERDIVARQVTIFETKVFLRRDGNLVEIEKQDDAEAMVYREWLLLELKSDWLIGGRTYTAGSLLATNLEGFLAGKRDFDVLFEPTERTSLDGISMTRNHLILTTLDNVRNALTVLTAGTSGWDRERLPGVPGLGTASVWPVDEAESDEYFLLTNDFLTPSTLSVGTVGVAAPEKLKEGPAFFDARGLEVTQHEATSKDGTKVPYFQIGPKDLKLDGTTPTIQYGYGGFQLSMLPGYDALTGAAWLERGGVYVVANIRGGGEFGPKWHQAAQKVNRPRAYEDFIAVAEDLIARKVTSPEHLGTLGGSNGGLLMGNMLTMRPDLWRAIVCQVPLLDMRHYHTMLAGASWMGEYGNPDLPEEWEFIQTFSPYHNVKKDANYPRTLFTTSTRDDRVHPGHARKMVARMKEQGHDVVYYENIEGGHGGAADNEQRAFMKALAHTFFRKELE